MSHSTKIKSVPVRPEILPLAVRELQGLGINCELLTNAQPRMYYSDQLVRQLGQKSEICDYVIKLADCPYDIGFIKAEDGTYAPVFDDYEHGNYMHRFKYSSVKEVLGCDPETIKEPLESEGVETSGSWGGDSTEPTNVACSMSKFLMAYSKQAAMQAASAAGHTVESCEFDANGDLQMVLQTY